MMYPYMTCTTDTWLGVAFVNSACEQGLERNPLTLEGGRPGMTGYIVLYVKGAIHV
jgi:hypothetical protein